MIHFGSIVLAFLAAYVYLYLRHRYLAETAAFWLFTFSAFALIAILVIGEKFDLRERGMEMKQAARAESHERVARGEAIDPRGKIPPPAGVAAQPPFENPPTPAADSSSETGGDAPYEWSQLPERNAKTLDFLQWICVGGVIAGAALLIREVRTRKEGLGTGD